MTTDKIISALDWTSIAHDLDAFGVALTGPLLNEVAHASGWGNFVSADPRRHRRRAAASRGRGDLRQDQSGRVRHGLVDRELGVRPDPQPVGPRTHARRVERDAGHLVVVRLGAGADTELEAPVGEQVDGRGFFGQHRRMTEVVVEHGRGEPERRGDLGSDRQGDHGRELAREVIWKVERGVPEVFGLAREVLPLSKRVSATADTEAE